MGMFVRAQYHVHRHADLYVTGIGLQDALTQTLTARPRPSWFLMDWTDEILRISIDRRFFVTQRGFMGTGPTSLLKGDVNAILCGGVATFALRPRLREYEVIGPCYVHGIMTGEAMSDDETEFYDIVLH